MEFSSVVPVTVLEHRQELVAVLAGNAIPLIGVGMLGWNISALVVLYWLELAVIFCFAVLRALLAGRRSELESAGLIIGALADRRASLSVPRSDVAIHLSSLPVVLIAIPLLSAVWLVVGMVTVGVVGADRLGDATYEMIVLAFFAMGLKEAGQTAVEYLYHGQYKEHSAQTAIRGPFIRGGLLFVGGLFTVMAAAVGSDSIASDAPISELDPMLVGTPVLLGIVLVKVGFDLAGVFRDQLTSFDESTAVTFGWAYEPPTIDPVDTTLTGDSTAIGPDWRGRLFGGVRNVWRYTGALKLGVIIWLVAVLFAFGQVWAIVAALIAAGIVVPLMLASIDWWVRFGFVEYRTDGDAIVAYDRLFDHALWRIEPWDETNLRVERTRLDSVLGTATIVVTLLDDSIVHIPCVANPDVLLAVFDRRAEGTTTYTECA
jgi:hypothetical protein